MKTLNIVCGIAVLLASLHFVHGIHHLISHDGVHGAMWWAIAAAVLTAVLSFVGGVLLLRRPGSNT